MYIILQVCQFTLDNFVVVEHHLSDDERNVLAAFLCNIVHRLTLLKENIHWNLNFFILLMTNLLNFNSANY